MTFPAIRPILARRPISRFLVSAALLAAVGLAAAPPPPASAQSGLAYPITRAENLSDVLWGTTVKDPFRWLENAKSPEVQEWMSAEDQLARGYLEKLPGREALRQRFGQIYNYETVSIPTRRGNRLFYTKRQPGQDRSVYYWREGESGAEKVLLDPNTWSFGATTSLGASSLSLDGQYLAFKALVNNSDEAVTYVIEVATGVISAIDVIPGTRYGGMPWVNGHAGFFYTWIPPIGTVTVDQRPAQAEVRFHRLGTSPADDPTVHEKVGRPDRFIGAGVSLDSRWLIITISGYIGNTVKVVDISDSNIGHSALPFEVLWSSETNSIGVTIRGDDFWILTNEDAPNWRLLKVKAGAWGRDQWQEILPGSPAAVLYTFNVLGGRLVVQYKEKAQDRYEIRELDGKLTRIVDFPVIGSASGIAAQPEDDYFYYSFSSFTVQPRIYRYSLASGVSTLWYEVKVPFDPAPYTTEQVWYTSKDGTRVSMFITGRKDLARDGNRPVYLTGYGGFNSGSYPSFGVGILPWLEAGGIYALPNLRGGNEYGEAWHRAGMLTQKQNVFDDFIGAAEFLIKERYTRPEKLAIYGASNGGLLVGAALVQRPDLFGAVVCGVPLLDMVRYHLYGSGRTWISEYGSAENEEQFRALYAYSPYHHVEAGAPYPATLFESADADDRVDPMHARKMAGAMQVANPKGAPTLLWIARNAGHGGTGTVAGSIEVLANRFAFLMQRVELRPASTPPTGTRSALYLPALANRFAEDLSSMGDEYAPGMGNLGYDVATLWSSPLGRPGLNR